MVDTGPKLPKTEKVDAPNRPMAAETKNEGTKVENMAMASPNRYTSAG